MLPGNQRSVTIEAPPDASVTLNGLDVDASYITESHAAYDSADENRFNPDAYRVIYTVGGLCGDVSVAVTDRDGRELPAEKSDGTSFVFDAIRQSVGITAPADAKVSVNGVELGEKCIIGSLLPKGLFQGLEKYADAIPDFILYRVDNLLGTPSVTAEDASGRDLTAVTAADSTVFGLAWDEALKEAQTQLVTDFMKAYVPYTVNEGENTGANLQRLLKFLLPGTDTCERLKNASEGISWLTGGTAEYNELTPDRFLSCGENSFVCRVTLSITVTADGNVRNTDGAYWLVFVRSGGNWLLGSMAAEKSGTPA